MPRPPAVATANTDPGWLTRNRLLAGWVSLVVVYLVWGSTYNAIAVGDRTIPPLLLAGTRYLIAGMLLLPLASRGHAPWRIPLPQWRSTFITGLLMLAGGNGMVTLGERTVPGGVAALLAATVPLWLLVFGVILRRRALRGVVVVALLLGIAGVVVLVRPAPGVHVDPAGAATILLGAALWAGGSLHAGTSEQPANPFTASAMQMLGGAVVLLVAGVGTGELAQLHLAAIGWSGWLALGWLIGGGSMVAFSAYELALRLLPVAMVSTYAFVNPLVAVLLGSAFFGEPLTLVVGVSALLTVAAVGLLVAAREGGGH